MSKVILIVADSEGRKSNKTIEKSRKQEWEAKQLYSYFKRQTWKIT